MRSYLKHDQYDDIAEIYLACKEYVASTYTANEQISDGSQSTIEQKEKEACRGIFYIDVGDLPFHAAQKVIERVKKRKVTRWDTYNTIAKPSKPTLVVKVNQPDNIGILEFDQYLEKVRGDFSERYLDYNIMVHGADISISMLPGIV